MKIKAFYKRYRSDEPFRNKINLYNGAATSFVLTCIQLYGGIKYKSVWFTSFAIYYGVLTIVKFYLARSVGKKGREGWSVFSIVGFVMSILNLALVTMISILITDPSIALHEYSLAIAIATAAWTLISAGMTIHGVFQMRNKNEPVMLADRLVQLTTAIVSVLMLQTSFIASISTPQIETMKGYIEEFGSLAFVPDKIATLFTNLFQSLALSNIITGVFVAVFSSWLTVYMIIRGTVEGKRLEKKVATTSKLRYRK